MDTLSTYGLLSTMSLHRIRLIMELLIDRGHLALSEGEYPTVVWSPRSRAVLNTREPLAIEMKIPAEREPTGKGPSLGIDPRRRSKAADPLLDVDEELLTRLKALRTRFAQQINMPAYIVFTDAALHDMCRKRPTTIAAFLDVQGVGQKKCDQYGDAFTAEIRAWLGTR
jgi:ATP-dependent DNA helicase RecQ